MRLTAGLFVGLCLLGAAPAQAEVLEDVLGREVPIGQGRPAIELYVNRDSCEVLKEQALQIADELRDELPLVVVHMDLRDVPGIFKGMARKELRKSHREVIESMRSLFRASGQEPPANLEQSLFLVADSNGESHREVGQEKGARRVLARVVGPAGEELTRGLFPHAVSMLMRAIESVSALGRLGVHRLS